MTLSKLLKQFDQSLICLLGRFCQDIEGNRMIIVCYIFSSDLLRFSVNYNSPNELFYFERFDVIITRRVADVVGNNNNNS